MTAMSFVFSLVVMARVAGASSWSEAEFRKQVAQYNYFTNSPATFATYCRADDCLSAYEGHTSLAKVDAVTSDSLISIGSHSKMVTAILTMMMVDRGVFGLDDELTEFFPQYARWQGVTVRHLLQHASGVPPYLFSQDGLRRLLLSVFNWRTRIWRPEDLVGIVEKQPLIFTPGSRIEYNNTNYILLGMILEKATGQPLGELLRREIFEPLAMTRSYLSASPETVARRVAGYMSLHIPLPGWLFNLLTYKVEKTGDYLETTKIFDDSFTWAAGGMISTTDDLAKLLRGLFSGKLMSASALAEMMQFREGSVLGFPLVYGLGLMKMPSAYGPLYGHGGLTPGYQSVSQYVKDEDATLVVAQNLGPAQLYSVYFELLDTLLKREDFREFVPDAELNLRFLPERSLHLRVFGRVLDTEAPPPVFPRAVGYSKVKGLREPTVYQVFEQRLATRAQTTHLTIEGLSGRNPFLTGNSEESRKPFVVVAIDPAALARPGLVTRPGEDELLFAYRGLEIAGANGEKTRCVFEVIDRSRDYTFQIDHVSDSVFTVGEAFKFVGHIPMTPATPADLPEGLESLAICP